MEESAALSGAGHGVEECLSEHAPVGFAGDRSEHNGAGGAIYKCNDDGTTSEGDNPWSESRQHNNQNKQTQINNEL